ncbi:MAG: FkbM family methyltransferase [Acidimicrobiales bacterium]|jgi:FkbM family methyltransferase
MAESQLRVRVSRWLSGRKRERIVRNIYATLRNRVPDRFLSGGERQARQYDRDTIRIAKAAMQQDSAFVDAGAHAGTILKHLARIAPHGRSYAFEPIPSLSRGLRAKFPEVVVEEVALSDFEGTATFHILTDDPARSSLVDRPEWEHGKTVQQLIVQVKRLDDCIAPELRIAFLKVDVEGAELALFHGARRILAEDRPVVVFECTDQNLPDVASFLKSLGLETSFLSRFPDGTTEETLKLNPGSGEYCFAAGPSRAA